MRRVPLAAAVLLALHGRASASPDLAAPQPDHSPTANPEEEPTPPLSVGRLAGELVAGTFIGLPAAAAGFKAGEAIKNCTGSEDCTEIPSAITGAMTGWILVAPLGVYLAGSYQGQTGSIAATWAGSVLGGLVGVGLGKAVNDIEPGVVIFALAAPLVGSMIGFNLTREYSGRRRSRPHIVPVASVASDHSSLALAGEF